MSEDAWRNLFIVLVVLIVLYFLFFRNNNKQEYFAQDLKDLNRDFNRGFNRDFSDWDSYPPISGGADLAQTQSATDDIKNLLLDKMPCHPDCCGDSWNTSYDGLTSDQIKQTIATSMDSGPYVRTNYTCANGPNGAGCPCITRDAYINLANRGQGSGEFDYIEPTLAVGGNMLSITKPLPSDLTNKSVRVNYPKLNDLELQREPQFIGNVKSYGSSLLQ